MLDDRIEYIAASWLSRADRGLSPDEQVELDAWLEQDIRHRVAFLRHRANWRRADRMAALKSPRQPRSQHAPRGVWLAAAAAVLVTITSFGVWHFLMHTDYETLLGQTQTVVLADGTRMELNTNTHVHAEVTALQRVVTLESGEAYFEVVHDTQRPFVVLAGNRRVVDVGTKFAVFRKGDNVRVVVREGQVRIENLDVQNEEPVLAQAGREVISNGSESVVVHKTGPGIADDLSWRQGVLVFDQKTLAEVADQFNRYNRRQIQVEGTARELKIGGRFKAENLDAFVKLMHRGFGLSVREQGDTLVVSR